ncbi:hypothetical protein Zmor_005809 [Zophobas morio]|uniref:Uncharacterized protein n=1 Tax=Zophobas morio TaxID=2755281 RepID=A0AA38IV84_9CUCU|nr:hypothetical protein Zmor_005804 [Zophobas morio]KAJ3661414.1 hypothetical protein Zmor_005809 [Zophobas morio]
MIRCWHRTSGSRLTVNFSNSECVDVVLFYAEREHLHHWYVVQHLDHGTFNLKLTIVALIGQKEYCKLKNKFWNATKKSPTSALADLQLKLEFYSL